MESLTIKDNERFLRQISKEVKNWDSELEDNILTLKTYCNSHDCFAMAAVQLGILKRIIYINSTTPDSTDGDEEIVLINPIIVEQKGKTEFWEACMSCLDNFALVERPYQITVKYTNKNGKEREEMFEGFSATVLSHEMDHLDGIFHMDRAKELCIKNKEERTKYRKEHPYKIISKDCDFSYDILKSI